MRIVRVAFTELHRFMPEVAKKVYQKGYHITAISGIHDNSGEFSKDDIYVAVDFTKKLQVYDLEKYLSYSAKLGDELASVIPYNRKMC